MQASSIRCLRVLVCFGLAFQVLLAQSSAVHRNRPRAPLAAGTVGKASDACALLSTSVIETVQGEAVNNTKASQAKGSAVITTQCLYSLATFSNSISLALTLPDPDNPVRRGPRDIWKQRFHGPDDPDQEPAADKERAAVRHEREEEEAARPTPVSGLGDEAYWVHSFVGTLYVLTGDAFLRISIGGKLDDSARMERAQILARDALARLR